MQNKCNASKGKIVGIAAINPNDVKTWEPLTFKRKYGKFDRKIKVFKP